MLRYSAAASMMELMLLQILHGMNSDVKQRDKHIFMDLP